MLTPADVSTILLQAYPAESGFSKALLRFKPYIYPFHEVVEFVPQGGSVLDVGCGMGMMTVLLANLGKIGLGTGFDVSEQAIAKASKALVPRGSEIVFKHIKQDSAWPVGHFDAALCIDVLHHVPREEQRAFVSNLARASGAQRIILKDISPKPFWMGMANVATDLLVNRQLVHMADEKDVELWLREEGFEIVENKRIHTLLYSHYLVVADRIHRG